MGSTPAPSTDGEFAVFTSLRYDPQLLTCAANTAASSLSAPTPFYLLSHHRDRMLSAAEHFSYPPTTTALLRDLSTFAQRLNQAVDVSGHALIDGQLKPILACEGAFTVEVTPVPAVPIEQLFPNALPSAPASRGPEDWTIVLDEAPTAPSDFTSYKTTARKMYDDARMRAWIQSFKERKEVLLWNEKHEIMEGSLTSVFVLKGGQWVTAAVGSGGQRGTTRRWALENGLAREGAIVTGDVKKGSWVVVSNGVQGIWGGWVA
ncbi:aminotransferase [Sphaerosporella brunnea]|uniref:Aminotransferase n=1 Tax=Sphaerosporella brunnea TaxID=1250544 RepID=A0A5J5ET05_9PEZI|nr:aminotransferase [Sphaerosporella brunnea]